MLRSNRDRINFIGDKIKKLIRDCEFLRIDIKYPTSSEIGRYKTQELKSKQETIKTDVLEYLDLVILSLKQKLEGEIKDDFLDSTIAWIDFISVFKGLEVSSINVSCELLKEIYKLEQIFIINKEFEKAMCMDYVKKALR